MRADLDSIEKISGIMTKAGGSKKVGGPMVNDRIIIDATWPYEKRDHFPEIHRFSKELRDQMLKKYPNIFK